MKETGIYMRSFLVWYKDKRSTSKKIEADIHINLWESNIRKKDDKTVYFDFGIMVHDIKNVKKIYLYCPFPVTKDDVKDLGECIIENNVLVGAIFNDSYKATSGIARQLKIELQGNKSKFTIYSVDVEHDLKINNIKNSHGSLLIFSFDKVIKNKHKNHKKEKYYFRMRIRSSLDDLHLMFQKTKNNSPFQDAFLITQVIDFRLNNLRSCNEFIRDKYSKGNQFTIKQIHYLLLRRATDVFIHQGENVSSRLLEKSLWNKYLEGLNENVIAYHFKRKEKGKIIDDYCVLSRFEYQQFNYKKIFAYFYMVMYLGILSGLFANLLTKCSYWKDIIVIGTIIFMIIIYYIKRKL